MKNFAFVNARSLEEAVGHLAALGPQAYVVAGATNVMVDIRDGKRNDKTLVNIRGIDALRGIRMEGALVWVGALTTIAEIGASELIKGHAPALYMAAQVFADPTTRNSATIGGNLIKASAGGDTLPPLMVMEADVHVKSARGERALPICDIFTGLGKTRVEPDELVTHFTFAPQPHTAFMKMGQRKSMAISVCTAAAYATVDGEGRVTDCRIALGAVASTPVRASAAEKALLGIKVDDEGAYEAMYGAVQGDINPRPHSVRASVEYRRQIVPVLVKRAVRRAALGDCGPRVQP
ncbi:MAG: xanthine dehydrogenase family protein subunit M [Lachnospiraceae bacterium]|nr:xanthine dehydrogenase family protein subunit M [Lachnospiraceae bacterium]